MLTVQLNVAPVIDEQAEFERAVALAAESDVAVVVVGTNEEVESEGFDRTSLALPGRQDELVSAVAAANPRTVVVVNSGAPVLLPWADEVAAVLVSWFPGQEFGNALADVLTGVVEPGGRLPVTWPASEEGLPSVTPVNGELPYDEGLLIGYRWYLATDRTPLFPFGHGLGYTTWAYEGMAVDGDTVTVSVRNTGDRPGREVVQVYASRPDSAVERAPRWLVGSAVVEAAAGESGECGHHRGRPQLPALGQLRSRLDGRARHVPAARRSLGRRPAARRRDLPGLALSNDSRRPDSRCAGSTASQERRSAEGSARSSDLVGVGLADLQVSDLGDPQRSRATRPHLLVRRRGPFLDLRGVARPVNHEDRIVLMTAARSRIVDLGVHAFHLDLGAVFVPGMTSATAVIAEGTTGEKATRCGSSGPSGSSPVPTAMPADHQDNRRRNPRDRGHDPAPSRPHLLDHLRQQRWRRSLIDHIGLGSTRRRRFGEFRHAVVRQRQHRCVRWRDLSQQAGEGSQFRDGRLAGRTAGQMLLELPSLGRRQRAQHVRGIPLRELVGDCVHGRVTPFSCSANLSVLSP